MTKYTEQELLASLKSYFGFDSFKGNQKDVIINLLEGKDTFVLMPTGGGKSLCYQLPSLICEGTAIIISPLIALMKNQVDAMRGFSTDNRIAHFLNSSLSRSEMNQVKDDVRSCATKMLYVAPESLTKEDNIEFLKSIQVSFYAIDEAHCISEWGHDFRPEYRRIKPIVESIGRAPIIALTATATPKVQHDIQKNLGMLDATVYKSSFRRENLYYEVRPKVSASKQIIRFIKENQGKSGIIYCLSRKKVEELAETLVVNGIKALPYHAGLDAHTRSRNQDMFLMEDVDVIVATIAFGMGIDKPDVRFVIHYNMPKSLEGYYQETGRAGRDGGEGKCISFYSYKDITKLEKFMQGKPVAEQEIGKQLLLETSSYAESSVCRVRQLLNYFGEILTEDCGNCDNCLNPKTQFEGKEYVKLALEVILAVKERFKAGHVSEILAGKVSSEIKTYQHDKLEIFGAGSEKEVKFWNAVLRQLLIARLIDKEIENYGLLKLTPKGKEFLQRPYSFLITEDHDYEESDGELNLGQGTGSLDPVLISMLIELRKKIAKKYNVPPFVVFQETSIEDMAVQYPITIEELTNIIGVGQGKAQKYGKEFVELIAQYVVDNAIERPQDMVVKSVVNKSGNKVQMIQSIDRKVALDTVAESKGMTMVELLEELERIVNSGTKINLDYYIKQVIEEDVVEEIFDYFRTSESESVQDAIDELTQDDYSEEEIRLVRIKFLSELGH
ncbi:MAG: ATP-dependent DNA helicase RecQ [Bacteroidetes bacterium ADurb.Bin217]|nr:MAG: ATP-dependent DNA helicase RecQ [Bacteroidetes bacterium ADurb.Bin217]